MIKHLILSAFSLMLFLSSSAHGATCSDIGFYCLENIRYRRVQYLEATGRQYLDTGIPLNSKYDMEMTWQSTKFVKNSFISGIWTTNGAPAILLAGMFSIDSSPVLTAMYDIDIDGDVGPEEIYIPFDTQIHTTYCYKNKGIWIDNESTLIPANYNMDLPSDKNFLIGARLTVGKPSAFWYGRVYSFVCKDNGHTKAEFLPVYDTQGEEYGMYDTISNKFFGSLGAQAFTGGDFIDEALPCTNAPEHAHYTSSGTADNCAWACDDGYGLHDGTCVPLCAADMRYIKTSNGLQFNLYPVVYSTPALHVKRGDTVCHTVLAPGAAKDSININHNGQIYHAMN